MPYIAEEDRTEWCLIEQGLYYEGANGVNVTSPGGGGVLPYMGYIGMCRCEGSQRHIPTQKFLKYPPPPVTSSTQWPQTCTEAATKY